MNKRELIIGMMRGRYVVPVISALDSLGVISALLRMPCKLSDFSDIKAPGELKAVLDYLIALNLLEYSDYKYVVTPAGRSVFTRSGSINVLESYRHYFDCLPDILKHGRRKGNSVDRRLNIIGSGNIHNRKYFQYALDLIKQAPASIIDLGCGDGTFLAAAAAKFPKIEEVLAVDLSEEATSYTTLMLTDLQISTNRITCSAEDVERWAKVLGQSSGRELITMWFVIHEFSSGSKVRVIEFFRKIRQMRPRAELIVGEIVQISPKILAENYVSTIMPEYLLFHDLSDQSPFTWETWGEVRAAIPYRLGASKSVDALQDGGGEIPASFIWHLIPA